MGSRARESAVYDQLRVKSAGRPMTAAHSTVPPCIPWPVSAYAYSRCWLAYSPSTCRTAPLSVRIRNPSRASTSVIGAAGSVLQIPAAIVAPRDHPVTDTPLPAGDHDPLPQLAELPEPLAGQPVQPLAPLVIATDQHRLLGAERLACRRPFLDRGVFGV